MFVNPRWSAIATKLPGRTDNEIKNVWHTHLKKKLLITKDDIQRSSDSMSNEEQEFILVDESIFDRVWDNPNVNQVTLTPNVDDLDHDESYKTLIINHSTCTNDNNHTSYVPILPLQRSYSETSYNNYKDNVPSPEEFPETDESFWSDVLSSDHAQNNSGSSSMEINMEMDRLQESSHASSFTNVGSNQVGNVTSEYSSVENGGDVDDFWFDVLFKAGEHIMFS